NINAAGNGIDLHSLLSGGDFSVAENGGSTATQLGLRTFALGTNLADLNHGIGVHTLAQQNAPGDDFSIRLQDGTLLHFRLDTQTTIGDVIDLINNAPGNGGKVTAQLATTGNGIELVSNVTGSSTFEVERENNSDAATDLGLIAADKQTSDPATS